MEREYFPKLEKYINKENVSQVGAFSSDVKIRFRLSVPRRLGTSAPILRINPDFGESRDFLSAFVSTDEIDDVFELEICPGELLNADSGLLYYTFVFPFGTGAYFTDTYNNVDYDLTETDNRRFRLLIYKPEAGKHNWLQKGVMYHAFVDRFCRGKGKVLYRPDSVINDDWENGVPQYGERAGSYVENNVFFGGNLWGIIEKLNYLKSLGVTVLYLSPIFEAKSNHKYDTGDYLKIDKGFGGEAAFDKLLNAANEKQIKVVLDGVFNHTGDDSRYFDRYDRYGNGAFSNPDSPYHNWYKWKSYPDEYECWWGVRIMPRLNHEYPDCRRFFTAADGVVESYIKRGVAGWRIDVADELNDEFLDELNATAKVANSEAAIIGEVWENAADKISYGKRRRYLQGGQLDSVMNYPLRNGIVAFARQGDAEQLYNTVVEIYASYPRQVCDCLMNIIGTHDTERILTVLGGVADIGYDNAELADKKMSAVQRQKAVKLLKIASAIQYTVYGIPSLYYGDEAGLEGYHDPFCRLPFPWGRENTELLEHYRKLGGVRLSHTAFDGGEFKLISHGKHFIVYERKKGNDRVTVAANRGGKVKLCLDGEYRDALTGKEYRGEISLLRDSVLILERLSDV